MKIVVYYPKIRGQLCGLKLGLGLKADTLAYFNIVGRLSRKVSFLKGVGIGYRKAIQIKKQLRANNTNLPFKEKRSLFSFLVSTTRNEFEYAKFEKTAPLFIEHIEHWVNKEIPNELYTEVEQLLEANKIQRAIDKVDTFNYENYRLKLIVEFEAIKKALPELREKSKYGKITPEQYQQGREDIENQLKHWLYKRIKISIEDHLSNLTSPNRHEVEEAMAYFADLFYFDAPISNENYVRVIKTLVDKLLNSFDSSNKSDLLNLIESSLYTNDSVVSKDAFYEVILYMTESKSPLFQKILEPLSQHEKLKVIISNYLNK